MTHRMYNLPYEDFDTYLSPKLRSKLHKTAEYSHFIGERARINRLASDHVANGGALSDPEIADELKELNRLATKMGEFIQTLKEQ